MQRLRIIYQKNDLLLTTIRHSALLGLELF